MHCKPLGRWKTIIESPTRLSRTGQTAPHYYSHKTSDYLSNSISSYYSYDIKLNSSTLITYFNLFVEFAKVDFDLHAINENRVLIANFIDTCKTSSIFIQGYESYFTALSQKSKIQDSAEWWGEFLIFVFQRPKDLQCTVLWQVPMRLAAAAHPFPFKPILARSRSG